MQRLHYNRIRRQGEGGSPWLGRSATRQRTEYRCNASLVEAATGNKLLHKRSTRYKSETSSEDYASLQRLVLQQRQQLYSSRHDAVRVQRLLVLYAFGACSFQGQVQDLERFRV